MVHQPQVKLHPAVSCFESTACDLEWPMVGGYFGPGTPSLTSSITIPFRVDPLISVTYSDGLKPLLMPTK